MVLGVTSPKAKKQFSGAICLPRAERLDLTHPGLGKHPLVTQLSCGRDEVVLGQRLKAHHTTVLLPICITQGPSRRLGLMVRTTSWGMAAIPPWRIAVIPPSAHQEQLLPGQHGLIHQLFMMPGLLRPRGWPPALCLTCVPAQHLNISNSLPLPITLSQSSCSPISPNPCLGSSLANRSVAPPGLFPNHYDASVETHQL